LLAWSRSMKHEEKFGEQFKPLRGAGIRVADSRSALSSRTKPRFSRIAVRDLLLLVQEWIEHIERSGATSQRQSTRQRCQVEFAVTNSKQTIGAPATRQFSWGSPKAISAIRTESPSRANIVSRGITPFRRQKGDNQNQMFSAASCRKQTMATQNKCQFFAMVFAEFSTGFSPRALLSREEAPRIVNRFMKFVLDKGNVFKPGAPRWAFVFKESSASLTSYSFLECKRDSSAARPDGNRESAISGGPELSGRSAQNDEYRAREMRREEEWLEKRCL
jgi:hypothetical protein